ncbi:MAG: hypothetical protein ACK5HL_01690 [Bacilli bacterium]
MVDIITTYFFTYFSCFFNNCFIAVSLIITSIILIIEGLIIIGFGFIIGTISIGFTLLTIAIFQKSLIFTKWLKQKFNERRNKGNEIL